MSKKSNVPQLMELHSTLPCYISTLGDNMRITIVTKRLFRPTLRREVSLPTSGLWYVKEDKKGNLIVEEG